MGDYLIVLRIWLCEFVGTILVLLFSKLDVLIEIIIDCGYYCACKWFGEFTND